MALIFQWLQFCGWPRTLQPSTPAQPCPPTSHLSSRLSDSKHFSWHGRLCPQGAERGHIYWDVNKRTLPNTEKRTRGRGTLGRGGIWPRQLLRVCCCHLASTSPLVLTQKKTLCKLKPSTGCDLGNCGEPKRTWTSFSGRVSVSLSPGNLRGQKPPRAEACPRMKYPQGTLGSRAKPHSRYWVWSMNWAWLMSKILEKGINSLCWVLPLSVTRWKTTSRLPRVWWSDKRAGRNRACPCCSLKRAVCTRYEQ